jgi:molybdenum cofactor cytidylyltransferase
MISCILLSAGESIRFGSPKALASLGKETVIGHLQQTLLTTTLTEIIIVLGAHRQAIEPSLLKHKKIRLVYNKSYKLGQASSFKTGLQEISADAKGVMLLPVDYPFILPATIDQIIDMFVEKKPLVLIPSYLARKGHPPIFDKSLFQEIREIDNGIGLNTVAQVHHAKTLIMEMSDPGIIASFNTQEEFEKLRIKIMKD